MHVVVKKGGAFVGTLQSKQLDRLQLFETSEMYGEFFDQDFVPSKWSYSFLSTAYLIHSYFVRLSL